MNLKATITILKKDLRLFFINEGTIYVSIVLSIGLLAAFRFGHGIDSLTKNAANAMLWVSQIISSIFLLMASHQWEMENKSFRFIYLLKLEPYVLYLGKALALTITISILWVFNVLFFFLFFSEILIAVNIEPIEFLSIFSQLNYTGFAAAIGIAFMGVLAAAIADQSRLKHAMLFILFFPLGLPILIAGSSISRVILQGKPIELTVLTIILAFDFIYMGLGILLYGTLLEE